VTVCRWNFHAWSVWWPAKFGMLRRTCEHCGALQHTTDKDTSRRIRGATQ
jgi:hypothetical protein